jgi:RHS repeat-associated protein
MPEETNFFWDPLSDNILQERDETGAVTAEYTTEPELYGNLISQNRGGVDSQYHFDAVGSILALTDDNQHVTDTSAYSAFGKVTEHTVTTANPFQYVGQKQYCYYDNHKDFAVRSRVYSPSLVRWLSRDRLGLDAGTNVYVYARSNPGTAVDPSGDLVISLLRDNLKEKSCGFEPRAEWDFTLGRVSRAKDDCEGYFVQKTEVRCNIGLCPDCPVTLPVPPTYVFYEAWFVDKGKEREQTRYLPGPGRRALGDYTDAFEWKSLNRCGVFKILGEVKFFCKTVTGDLGGIGRSSPDGTWRISIPRGSECGISQSSGNVPSTGGKPTWWEDTPLDGPATHFLTASWCCCPGGRTLVTADVYPGGRRREF